MTASNDQTMNKPATLSPELEKEINEAMAALDSEDAEGRRLKQAAPGVNPAVAAVSAGRPAAIRGPRVVQAGREHRTGKIVSVGPTDIFIEFGPKELGIIPRIQYPDDALPKVGDSLEVVVDKYEAAESLFVCSRPGSVQKAAWEMLEAGQVVEGRVTGVVSGKDGKQAGLELEVAKHRAFMPASQVSIGPVPDLTVFVGEKMKASIVRVERMGKGNIVLSRRDVLDQERQEQAGKLKDTLAEGQTLEGTVRKIMPFGAFVDLGGIDGLVHISDLSYDRVGFGEKAVEKHVKEGQKVTVKILKLDWENNRISLGLKQTQSDPFASATNTIQEGSQVTGKITKIMEFGAFCEIAPGVEGLIHISELDYKRIAKVDDAVKPDEVVQVKILKIDPQNRRISLSIKATKAAPEAPKFEGGEGGKPGGGPGGGPGRGPGGRGGFGGKGGGKDRFGGKTAEEILKETPELRRMREKFKKFNFKGGLS